MGGVTFSMLSRYLSCKERFRLHVVEGLRPTGGFNAPIEFGQMWHTCEEALAAKRDWKPDLLAYAQKLYRAYPFNREQVEHWFMVCQSQFPEYINFWAKHKDVKARTPLLQEKTFQVPYTLPSGRTVYLRGKWDSVDLIGKGKDAGIYIQENKTKGDIDEAQLRRQLTFDLQTMIYVVALQAADKVELFDIPVPSPLRIAGVRYNVIRRACPIRRHKATSKKPEEGVNEFYNRLTTDYFQAEPENWFMRWNAEVSSEDIERFKNECLNPLLENVADDFDWWADCLAYGPTDGYNVWSGEVRRDSFSHHCPRHYRHPFGIRNILDEGGSTDLDEYLLTGSEVGLTRVTELFTELKP